MNHPTARLTAASPAGKRLLDSLQSDLRSISNEAKRKHPPLKEAAESGIVKLRSASTKHEDLRLALLSESPEIMEPFFMACDTKLPKLVQFSLTGIHRMITSEAVSSSAAINLVTCLWNLMENGVEELKVLQTATLLVSTSDVLQGESLAKGIAICFRLNFTKNQTTNNAASATVRQIVSVVFERVVRAGEIGKCRPESGTFNFEELKQGSRFPPKSLRNPAVDAFMLFQDLVQLVNAEQPLWLLGLTEMTRTFGLELLEMIFSSFPDVFFAFPEFSFLLKEKVCPLVIKLFSPSLKHRNTPPVSSVSNSASSQAAAAAPVSSPDKSFYPISIRLLRIVTVLIKKYHMLLETESEIFMALLIKLLDSERPEWQRVVAAEVMHKLCLHSSILKSFVQSYDMRPHSSKILRDMTVALGIFVQSHFVSTPTGSGFLSSLMGSASSTSTNSHHHTAPSASSQGARDANVPAFSLRNVCVPLAFSVKPGQAKSQYLDQLDKSDVPIITEGYGLTTAYYCLCELSRAVVKVVDGNSLPIDSPIASVPSLTPGSAVRADANRASRLNTRVKLDASATAIDEETRAMNETLLLSSWTGLVAAFSLLLEASNDESVSNTILRILEVMLGLHGVYGLHRSRSAFTTTLCRSSLPLGYHLSALVFQIPSSSSEQTVTGEGGNEASVGDWVSETPLQVRLSNNASMLQHLVQQTPISHTTPSTGNAETTDLRQQVVAVGTGLPTLQSNIPTATQGPVMLTVKNMHGMKTILNVAHSYGSVLDECWHPVLLTLQHLVWILGLKPISGGSLKAGRPGSEGAAITSHVISTSAMSDLPVLSAMLSRLFTSSVELDDNALTYLTNALIKLSQESCEIAHNNREPSFFAIAKLLETTLVNLSRIEVVWKTVSVHLLTVCKHPQLKMREWGSDALTRLVIAAVSAGTTGDADATSTSSTRDKFQFLSPLQSLSDIGHADLRQKQLEVCLQIIQSCGERLADGWPQVVDIVGAVHENHSENLIRLAFQSLQVIVSDYLHNTPAVFLSLVIDAAARFGSQTQELNVSLTAIGSIWNIADYLFQNQSKLRDELAANEEPHRNGLESELPASECVWMGLFRRLAHLCTDVRPSVRKSASQTLFAALSSHGQVLAPVTWQPIVRTVLFPLLDRVNHLTTEAPTERIVDVPKSMGMTGLGVTGSGSSILLHHSRNTVYKQWAETQVLTLSGVCHLFSLKKGAFVVCLPDFPDAWSLVLRHVRAAALSRNTEVAHSALTCLQDLLSETQESNVKTEKSLITEAIWVDSWDCWCVIGEQATKAPSLEEKHIMAQSPSDPSLMFIASQSFLTTHIKIFLLIYPHIESSFSIDQIERISRILQRVVAVPVDSTTQSFLVTVTANLLEQANNDLSGASIILIPLTPLQDSVFSVIDSLNKDYLSSSKAVRINDQKRALIAPTFELLAALFSYASLSPAFGDEPPIGVTDGAPEKGVCVRSNFVPFGEKALRTMVTLYQSLATDVIVMQKQVLHRIVQELRTPLSLKYDCPSPSTWRLAVKSLVAVLQTGLPVARANPHEFVKIWADLALTLDAFLFPHSKPPMTQTLEEQQHDESFDVLIVELIRDFVLPYASQIPKEFVLQVVSILNRGSIHSATTSSPLDMSGNRKLREEFARSCFETLLQFSFLGPKGSPHLFMQTNGTCVRSNNNLNNNNAVLNSNGAFSLEVGLVNRLAVTSLLKRFDEVIVKFVEDEKLSGKCPLARHRVAEISFVLKALATLISSLKKAPLETVEQCVWQQLISLFPALVECTTSGCALSCPSLQVPLRECLMQYKELLHAPAPHSPSSPTGVVTSL